MDYCFFIHLAYFLKFLSLWTTDSFSITYMKYLYTIRMAHIRHAGWCRSIDIIGPKFWYRIPLY